MIVRPGLCVALLLITHVAHGQTYRCTSGSATYYSDRPCPTVTPDKLGAYGPLRTMPSPHYSRSLPSAPKAQEHVQYLGAECASINEAIRTAPSRGVRGDVLQSLRDDYQQKCAWDDQDARKMARDKASQQMQARTTERQSALAQRRQAEAQSSQCLGMRDVIASKRKRESLFDSKEVATLRDLERSYNERCLSR